VHKDKLSGARKVWQQHCGHPIQKEDMAMQVTWNEQVCIHSAECVKNLPEVFKVVDGQFVIEQSGASDEAIRQTVAKCPSGALQITET